MAEVNEQRQLESVRVTFPNMPLDGSKLPAVANPRHPARPVETTATAAVPVAVAVECFAIDLRAGTIMGEPWAPSPTSPPRAPLAKPVPRREPNARTLSAIDRGGGGAAVDSDRQAGSSAHWYEYVRGVGGL